MKNLKIVLSLSFCLLLTGLLAAQNSSVVAHEEISTDGDYKFWVEVEDNQMDMLTDLYFHIAKQPAVAKLEGTSTTTLDAGVTLAIDTNNKELALTYNGTDEKALERAKGLSQKVIQYIETAIQKESVPMQTLSPSSTQVSTSSEETYNTEAFTESSKDAYKFWIEVNENQADELVQTYYDLSGQTGSASFRGQDQHSLEGGILMSLDTDQLKMVVEYEGRDRELRRQAKAIAERVNAYLGYHGTKH